MQMCVVELKDRPGKPLFHLEHYIEGKYIKYNSNSGFVRDDTVRLTPQVRPRRGGSVQGTGSRPPRALKPCGASHRRVSRDSHHPTPAPSASRGPRRVKQGSFLCVLP